MKKVRIIAIFLLLSSPSFAQDRAVHEIYSMMRFNFTKYVQWPDHAHAGEFVIGVIGNEEVYHTLNTWYEGKTKGPRTYVIKKFASSSEVTECHVAFIDKSGSMEFERVNAKVMAILI
jgi:hypothetical protein